MGTIIMLVVLVGMIWFMQRSQKKQAQFKCQVNTINV